MMLDTYDLELLMLCGLARYLPAGLRKKYDNSIFNKQLTDTLMRNRLIKYIGGTSRCYRLTRHGRDILYQMGYHFPDDARPRKEGSIFKRRIISADIDAMLYCAGIDIYASKAEQLFGGTKIYIPSLTIRADVKSRTLAGTRFYGILKLLDDCFIIYHAENTSDGIYPTYEKDTVDNLVPQNAGRNVLITGNTSEEIFRIMFPKEPTPHQRGEVPFSEISKVWNYPIYLIPLNRDGVLQLSIMAAQDFKGKIIRQLKEQTQPPPSSLSNCDAISKERAYIVAIDMNIMKIQNALCEAFENGLLPTIICLPFQRDIINKKIVSSVTAQKGEKQTAFTVLSKTGIEKVFPELVALQKELHPCRTKEGDFVILNDSD